MFLKLLIKIQDLILPIRKSELPKFMPMILLFFLISLIYNILRALKISLVISSPGTGAEIIPFLKIWGILPGAILLTYFFTVLSKRLRQEVVFYTMTCMFLGYFLIFLFVLYPFSSYVELSGIAEFLSGILPLGAKGFIAMIRYWHLSIFYTFSELWGSVILSMLFWGFVNEVTFIHEAKRFYSVFAVGGNLAAIAAGQVGLMFSFEKEAWGTSIVILLSAVLFFGALIIALYWYVNRLNCIREARKDIAKHIAILNPESEITGEDDVKGFTFVECLTHVAKSKYLLYLTLVVVGYNVVFNLVDVLWTDQLSHRFRENSGGINIYMSKVLTSKGLIATALALISGYVIRRFGWLSGAIVTPMIILITSALFLPLILFNSGYFIDFVMTFFPSPLTAAVFIGAMQNSMTRASKYTFFDTTKEIAFIPLGAQDQRKGKAVIDGISSRLGKSGGSFIFQCLLMFCSTISATIPYVSGIIFVMLGLWIYAIFGLNRQIIAYTKLEEK